MAVIVKGEVLYQPWIINSRSSWLYLVSLGLKGRTLSLYAFKHPTMDDRVDFNPKTYVPMAGYPDKPLYKVNVRFKVQH